MGARKRRPAKRRERDRIPIGSGCSISYYSWAPDDLPENRKRYGTPLPNVPRAGLIFYHPRADGKPEQCIGSVQFDLLETKPLSLSGAKWQVQSWDPLTLTPSILCRECGAHGYITNGQWRSV